MSLLAGGRCSDVLGVIKIENEIQKWWLTYAVIVSSGLTVLALCNVKKRRKTKKTCNRYLIWNPQTNFNLLFLILHTF